MLLELPLENDSWPNQVTTERKPVSSDKNFNVTSNDKIAGHHLINQQWNEDMRIHILVTLGRGPEKTTESDIVLE